MRQISLIIAVLALAIAAPAIAGKGGVPNEGNGNGGGNSSSGGGGGHATVTGSCTVSGTTVTGTGLPTDEVLNFMITDATGTWGWVLGYTDTGSWSESVPAPTGATTYEFASRTWGPDGSKYSVFASCST